jgi:hypothetical protein
VLDNKEIQQVREFKYSGDPIGTEGNGDLENSQTYAEVQ